MSNTVKPLGTVNQMVSVIDEAGDEFELPMSLWMGRPGHEMEGQGDQTDEDDQS